MIRSFLAALSVVAFVSFASAHCQVPCGIYGDQLRFEQMLEDEHTISKAQIQINEAFESEMTPQAANQLARWVATKEEHATKIQQTMLAYFLAQRIKPSDDASYAKKLMAAHAIIVSAMKCKQSADPDTAKVLEKAIFDFYRAYEGKEPDFDHEH